jgi:chromosome segregation ATPase
MTTQRPRLGSLSAMRAEKRQSLDKYPARLFPVQHEIQKLEDELNAFNDRIAELENEGHRGHATEVLKANAIDFARQIDELRCVLVESAPKDAPNGKILNSRLKI